MEQPSCSKAEFKLTEKHSYSAIEDLEKLLESEEDISELSDIGDSEVEEECGFNYNTSGVAPEED